jgi:hypothetical protein
MGEITQRSKKGFFEKPESITKVIFGAGLIFLLKWALPYIIDAVHAGILLGISAVVLYIVLDPKFRNLLSYVWDVAMRKLTNGFVKIDPISIMKVYIQNLKKKNDETGEQIDKLAQAIGNLDMKIEKNNTEIENSTRLAKVAEKRNSMIEAGTHAKQVGRLVTYNNKLTPLREKMMKLNNYLEKLKERCEYVIIDMQNDVDMKADEYKALKAGTSAFKSAMAIANGSADDRYMFDMALEELQIDMGNKVGQIDKALRDSTKFINMIDIENDADLEKGLEILNMLNIDDMSKNLITSKQNSPITINAQPVAQPATKSRFGSYLKG